MDNLEAKVDKALEGLVHLKFTAIVVIGGLAALLVAAFAL